MTSRSYWHELKALAILTGPILISQFSQASYGLIDTIMAGQVSPLDLAAVAVGAGIWLPLFLLTTGTLLATTPLVAEARGAGDHHRIPHITHQALWLALLVGGAGLLLVRNAAPILTWLDVPIELRSATSLYLEGVSWGMPAVGLFFVLRCYCEAQDRPVPVMIISLGGLVLNVFANALFIYGSDDTILSFLNIPAMGGPGCGWATSVVIWTLSAVMLLYVLLAPSFHPVRLMRRWAPPHRAQIRATAALGFPIGLAIFFEVSSFSIVAILISPLGATTVAGHQVAMSVTSMIFMIPLSLAIALTIRIGQGYGAQDIHAINHSRRVGLTATTLVASCTALLLLLFREPIAAVYSDDLDVQQLATQLMLFAVFYQIADALQVGAAGCLRGIQDTRSPMLLTLIAYWLVAIPFGFVAGSTDLLGKMWGAHGYWAGLVLGLTIASILLNWKLRRQVKVLKQRWQA